MEGQAVARKTCKMVFIGRTWPSQKQIVAFECPTEHNCFLGPKRKVPSGVRLTRKRKESCLPVQQLGLPTLKSVQKPSI